MVRLSEQDGGVLELNLPFDPLAEELDLLSLSVLLWTCDSPWRNTEHWVWISTGLYIKNDDVIFLNI